MPRLPKNFNVIINCIRCGRRTRQILVDADGVCIDCLVTDIREKENGKHHKKEWQTVQL